MLVLSRKLNESIMIGDEIEIMVLDIREGQVKLGIKAPRSVSIHRQEVFAEIRDENRKAQQTKSQAQALDSAARALKKKKPPTPDNQ